PEPPHDQPRPRPRERPQPRDKQCSRPDQDAAAGMPRQMHTKKWQPRIRNGIDQRPDKLIPPEAQIRPPNGNDPRIRVATIHDGEPIRRATSAEENPLRPELVCGMGELDTSGFALDS